MDIDSQGYSNRLILYHLACSILEKLEKEYGLTADEKESVSEALGKRHCLAEKSIFTI